MAKTLRSESSPRTAEARLRREAAVCQSTVPKALAPVSCAGGMLPPFAPSARAVPVKPANVAPGGVEAQADAEQFKDALRRYVPG